MKESVHFVFGTIYVICGVGGLSCHGYLIWLLRSRWWLAKHRLLFHLNFIISNLGILTLSLVSAVSHYRTSWAFGSLGCQLYGFTSMLVGFVSIWSVSLLVGDVFLRVYFPVVYGRLPLVSYAAAVVIVWGFCFILALLPVLGVARYAVDLSHAACGLDWTHTDSAYVTYLVSISVCCFFLPYTVMIVGLLAVRCQRYKQEDGNATPTATIFAQEEVKVYLWLALVSLTAWTPYALLCYQFIIRDPLDTSSEVAAIPSLITKVMTSCIPFVYLWSRNTWQFHGTANTHSEDSTL